MINADISYVVISDIHLGHRKNKAIDIINNFKSTVIAHHAKRKFSMMFLAGDVFDGLINLPSDDTYEIILWVSWLLEWCSGHNVDLRVLEGTPSHDWQQSRLFDSLGKALKVPCDFRYESTLSIEHVEHNGLTILYVPDEWAADTEDTYKQVLLLLEKHNLKQVDIAIMHGQFGYQLPAHIQRMPRHNEDRYLEIVRYYISIGHVHNHSVHKRIVAQGSFDRLAHGEESPKGLVHIDLHPDGSGEHYFIPNANAKIFKTVDVSKFDLTESMDKLHRAISRLPDGSHLRIKSKSDHPIVAGLDLLKKQYPFINITKLITNEIDDAILKSDRLVDAGEYTPITITKENIVGHLLDSISTKHELGDNKKHLTDLLKDFI